MLQSLRDERHAQRPIFLLPALSGMKRALVQCVLIARLHVAASSLGIRGHPQNVQMAMPCKLSLVVLCCEVDIFLLRRTAVWATAFSLSPLDVACRRGWARRLSYSCCCSPLHCTAGARWQGTLSGPLISRRSHHQIATSVDCFPCLCLHPPACAAYTPLIARATSAMGISACSLTFANHIGGVVRRGLPTPPER